MPVSHITKVFAAKDCMLYPLTAVPAGGTPTYGTGIDVPGIKTVGISGDINTVELRGDNRLLDVASTLGNITVELEFAKASLDVLATVFNEAVVDSGTSPAATAEWTLLGDSETRYFGLSCKAAGADPIGGDVHFMLHRLIVSSFPEMGLAEEDYQTVTMEAMALPLLSTDKWVTVQINETAAALAAPA